MKIYNITNKNVGSVTADPLCLPNKYIMESMLSAGYSLYIDGIKQTKADTLKFISECDKIKKEERK